VKRDRTGDVAGLAAVGLAACCGLPLPFGAGSLSAAVGLAVGSGLVLLAGITMAAVGWVRWRRRRRPPTCDGVTAAPGAR
jgi:hypothetical protein